MFLRMQNNYVIGTKVTVHRQKCMCMQEQLMADDFSRAKNLLLGTVTLANQERTQESVSQDTFQPSCSRPSQGPQQLSRSRPTQESRISLRLMQKHGNSSQLSCSRTQSVCIQEHKRLFGYQPSKPLVGSKWRRKGSYST